MAFVMGAAFSLDWMFQWWLPILLLPQATILIRFQFRQITRLARVLSHCLRQIFYGAQVAKIQKAHRFSFVDAGLLIVLRSTFSLARLHRQVACQRLEPWNGLYRKGVSPPIGNATFDGVCYATSQNHPVTSLIVRYSNSR